jgi:hypothetical protein
MSQALRFYAKQLSIEVKGQPQEQSQQQSLMQVPASITVKSFTQRIPSGKHTKNYGKSPSLMGKSSISMVHFQ